MTEISFRLAEPYPLLNRQLRMHYRQRKALQKRMMHEILHAIGYQRPAAPMPYATVRIERHSVGTPDRDGLIGGTKPLLDCLTMPRLLAAHSATARNRVRNPLGLGFVIDDDPDHIVLDVVAVKSTRAGQCTLVRISPAVRQQEAA